MTRLRATLAGLGAVALTVSGGAAHAGPPVYEAVEEWDDLYVVECGTETEDPSDDITVESRVVGSMEVTVREHRADGVFYFTGSGHELQTFTNVDTGRSWTGERDWLDKDVRLISLDGDVATIQIASVDHFVVYDDEGVRVSRNDGRFSFVVEVDLSTGEVLSEYDHRLAGRFGVGDFCADAQRFTVD